MDHLLAADVLLGNTMFYFHFKNIYTHAPLSKPQVYHLFKFISFLLFSAFSPLISIFLE